MAQMVQCVKLKEELPGIEFTPYPGELGQRIRDNVSQQAWQMWIQHSVILINHYGLSLADPQAQDFMMAQAEEFFFSEGSEMPDEWTPVGQGGKGAPMAAPRK